MARGKREGLLIAGGGLAGCLAALAMARARPEVPILLVEEGGSFGGNHIWSFFDDDLDEEDRWLVEPLISHHWEGYYVAFPGHSRKLKAGYNSIRSEDLDAAVRATLKPEQYRLGTRIVAVREDELVLPAGEKIRADGAIDARGATNLSMLEHRWHKFLGREYRFDRPHRVDRPVLMDATVERADGFRFVRCLPFDETRLLVEDSYYSDSPELDAEAIGARIDAYVAMRGWHGGAIEREESGVLPIALGGDLEAFLRVGGARVAKIGLRAGLFHPVTGYSLADAARAAVLLTQLPEYSGGFLHDMFAEHALQLWRKRELHRAFVTTLFKEINPSERRAAMERFYRLDAGLISRFHAAKPRAFDRRRLLAAAKG